MSIKDVTGHFKNAIRAERQGGRTFILARLGQPKIVNGVAYPYALQYRRPPGPRPVSLRRFFD